MPEISYETVQPLVAEARPQGRTLEVTFACPVSGKQVRARHNIPYRPDTTDYIADAAKRTVMNELRWAVLGAMRSAFGSGVVGRTAGHVASDAVYGATRNVASSGGTLSAKEQKLALVEAFKSVASQFAWDEGHGRWISKEAAEDTLSPFARQLQAAPLSHPYDRLVASRMMVEIAAADGRFPPDEEAFLTEFLDPEAGALQSLATRPVLTDAELGQCSRGEVRATLLMLAWALALADQRFDDSEQYRLADHARGLGLAGPAAAKIREMAQGFVLDAAMERLFVFGAHDARSRGQLYEIAGRMGMGQDEASLAEARFLRRRGMG